MINSITKTLVTKASSYYETQPYGVEDQDTFINQVIEIKTELNPLELHQEILKIEETLGRTSKGDLKPREIDIDILFYENVIIETDELIVPHRDLHNRGFVLEPLMEINPDFIHPIFKKSVKELLSQLKDNLSIKKIE